MYDGASSCGILLLIFCLTFVPLILLALLSAPH
jgi:TM2 domain-containing membrane protein YozV